MHFKPGGSNVSGTDYVYQLPNLGSVVWPYHFQQMIFSPYIEVSYLGSLVQNALFSIQVSAVYSYCPNGQRDIAFICSAFYMEGYLLM